MIDDLKLFESPANDLTVEGLYPGDFINDWTYTYMPVSQVTDIAFTAVVTNYGYEDQLGTVATFSVDGGTPYELVYDALASVTDTLISDPLPVDNSIGTRVITVTVPDDDVNTFNTDTTTIEVTEFYFGHNTPESPQQRGFDTDEEVGIGTRYVMNADAEVGGMRVWFGEATTVGTELQAILYKAIGGSVQAYEFLAQSSVFMMNQATLDANDYMTIGFDDGGPVMLEADSMYFCEIRKSESTDRMWIRSDPSDDDNGTVCYGSFGVGDLVNFFIGWTFTPAVQLVFDPTIAAAGPQLGLNEVTSAEGFELRQNMPNPANFTTAINYTLAAPSQVTITLRDMTGRVVMTEYKGQQGSGTQRAELNVSQLGSGIYSYTLQAGNVSLTKQMLVK